MLIILKRSVFLVTVSTPTNKKEMPSIASPSCVYRFTWCTDLTYSPQLKQGDSAVINTCYPKDSLTVSTAVTGTMPCPRFTLYCLQHPQPFVQNIDGGVYVPVMFRPTSWTGPFPDTQVFRAVILIPANGALLGRGEPPVHLHQPTAVFPGYVSQLCHKIPETQVAYLASP